MKKVLIFGAAGIGFKIYDEIKEENQILGFLDNDAKKWGLIFSGGAVLGNAGECAKLDFDEVIVAVIVNPNSVKKQLLEAGVPLEKINTQIVETWVQARINFMRDFASDNMDIFEENICVAEGGVFRGDFSKEINKCFPKQKLYLFDTFSGFDKRDTDVEQANDYSTATTGNYFQNTSEEYVLSRLPHREQAIICKGYFPETTLGIEHAKFGFVNLDFDLYNPILEGLRFFYSRMSKGGCILVHDYFNPGYKGVKEAVMHFEAEQGKLVKFPIGDHCSIGILR